MMTRRGVLGAVGLAGIAKSGPARTDIELWESVDCPGCKRPVAFLPAQHFNTCAWCGRTCRR